MGLASDKSLIRIHFEDHEAAEMKAGHGVLALARQFCFNRNALAGRGVETKRAA